MVGTTGNRMNVTVGYSGTVTASHGYAGIAILEAAHRRFLLPNELALLQGWHWDQISSAHKVCQQQCHTTVGSSTLFGKLVGNGMSRPVVRALMRAIVRTYPELF